MPLLGHASVSQGTCHPLVRMVSTFLFKLQIKPIWIGTDLKCGESCCNFMAFQIALGIRMDKTVPQIAHACRTTQTVVILKQGAVHVWRVSKDRTVRWVGNKIK